ncbi:hypothetical protein QBC37DRAFT_73595 [Rhypophila decipiens]|uniref:Uncharacterized protein n=1 Tax=Rhypophila decipiens TaxID=261697 RepID=A0AAN7BFV2_9PEZI|nr:hypothetical protein QBC37DRAFT_73595 [Rhypophila decipiens]
MAPDARIGCRPSELPPNSRKRPVSRSLYPLSPPNSNQTLGGCRTNRQLKPATIPANTYNTKRGREGATRSHREWLKGCRDVGRRQSLRRKKTTRRSHSASGETEGKGASVVSDASSVSADLSKTLSSCTSEVLLNHDDSTGTHRPSPTIQPTCEKEPDAALLRRRALKKQEEQERKRASEKYQETGDMSVFEPFMAPFFDGPDRPDLGSWVWDASVERFRREHKLNGRIVWAPTDDSFI